MKALTNILNYILLLLMILIASCTEDAAEVDNLERGEEYVTVRMQVPGMKNATTRAEEAEDNLTSVWALVFRDGKLVSKTEVTTESSTLTTTTSTTGTFNIPRPKSEDVIHFLGNVPSDVTLPDVGDDESALCNLETGDPENLSYWGTATYTSGDVIDNVTLYRNMAKIEIAAVVDECTFPEDQLFIVGLVNANQVGALVPCNEEGTFGYRDEPTLPESPSPKTDEDAQPLVTSLYVFEHDNPDAYTEANKDNFFCVICKIGKYYYKVALTSDGETPYDIIRNHKYTILVNDLDEVPYDDGLTEEEKYQLAVTSDPINLKVIETTYLVFNYTNNPTVYLNGGASSTLPVQITVPQDASLTEFNISATGFAVTASSGTVSGSEGSYTYAGGSTTFTFTPNSGLAAGTYPITLSGSGNYLHVFTETITVTIDATMMAVTPTTATINMDNGQENTTLTLTKPANVDNVSVSTDVFNVSNTDNEYTFTPKNSNIAAGNYTVTFADSKYSQVSTTATITVVNTPKVTFTNTGSQTIRLNDTPLSVTMDVPEDKTLSEFGIKITPATGLNVAQGENQLTLTEGVYTTSSGVSGPNTFTFTPTATGEYTITFSGSGEGVNMPQESERTINLTVNAAAVTTMSATSGTINMDNSETSTTITLTKPSGVNTLRINVSDGNAFDISTNANVTNQWTDNGNCYTISGNSETVDFTFTLKNGFNTAGEYTVTFSNYSDSQMSATATITIVNTPDLQYSYTNNATLYLNDGNGSPTTLPVTITVPEGSTLTQLNISASGFIIKQGDTTLSESGSYTYTGGSTAFTFTPNSDLVTGTYTISFRGSGTNLNVPEETISVTVKDTKPAGAKIWEGSEPINYYPGFTLPYDLLKDYLGEEMCVDVLVADHSNYKQIQFKKDGNDYQSFNSNLVTMPQNELITLKIIIPTDLTTAITIFGDGLTLKKFYIE